MERLGAYAVLDVLGRGGMGVVYRARHGPTGAVRALKVLERGADAELVLRFRREAEALARVGGDFAVVVHETGVEGGRFYYAMDLVPGGSLRDRLRARGRLEAREAIALGARLARALDRCHALGIVHRDLKPENVLFDELERPRLADFGCARDVAAAKLTQTGAVLGTPAYMAPEQLEGLRSGAPADVYALGLMLRELVTGELPGGGKPLVSLFEERRAPLAPLGPGAPAGLDAILARALAPAAASRMTAKELAAALEGLAAGAPPETRKVRESPRGWGVAVLGALVVLALGVLALALGVRHERRAAPPEPPPPSVASPSPAARFELTGHELVTRVERALSAGAVTSATVPFPDVRALAAIVPEPHALALLANAAVLYRRGDVEPLLAEHPRSVALATLDALARLADGSRDAGTVESDLDEAARRPGSMAVPLAGKLARLLRTSRELAAAIRATHAEQSDRDVRELGSVSALAAELTELDALPAPVLDAALAPLSSIAVTLAAPGLEHARSLTWSAAPDARIERAMLESAVEPLSKRRRVPAALFAGLEATYEDISERSGKFAGKSHVTFEERASYAQALERAAHELAATHPLLAATALARTIRLSDEDEGERRARDARALLATRAFEGADERWAKLVAHQVAHDLGGLYRGTLRTFEPSDVVRVRALEEARLAFALDEELGHAPDADRVSGDEEDLVSALLENGREGEVGSDLLERITPMHPLGLEVLRRRNAGKLRVEDVEATEARIGQLKNPTRRWNGWAVCALGWLDLGQPDPARACLAHMKQDQDLAPGVGPYIEAFRIDRIEERIARAEAARSK